MFQDSAVNFQKDLKGSGDRNSTDNAISSTAGLLVLVFENAQWTAEKSSSKCKKGTSSFFNGRSLAIIPISSSTTAGARLFIA